MPLHPRIAAITDRIIARSAVGRAAYLGRMDAAASAGKTPRSRLGCANQAHGFAACGPTDKARLREGQTPNLAIVTAYNDMLSAHQPYEHYPTLLRDAARDLGATAQVASGVPAMCDGITQGEAGMDMSLFSRDTIAMAAAVGLSHATFDGALYLGICDKIVPGLVIGALSFGHLPSIFVPAGPMTSGISNDEKTRVRQLFAEGKVERDVLLESEAKSYHGPGTCTFYGSANTNQMLMEVMGMHLPGAAFVNPGTELRDALTRATVSQAISIMPGGDNYTPLAHVLDERAFVNGIIGLHATGGSTNHTIHIVAMAAAAGIILTWKDLSDLAEVTPLMARIYPNGKADVNHFHAAGGMGYLIGSLLEHGLLHDDVTTIYGKGLHRHAVEPYLNDGVLAWRAAPKTSSDSSVLRPANDAFQATGGLQVLHGNIGHAVIKTSAIKAERHIVEAPARVFHSQEEFLTAFSQGILTGDFVAVLRFQGPHANGMPELHKLMPPLGVMQDKGQLVALVTDGRLSGASGKVPAAIHVTPEAARGGAIARVRDGDIILLDAVAGTLSVKVAAEEWESRETIVGDLSRNQFGAGRELFAPFRDRVGPADRGASVFSYDLS